MNWFSNVAVVALVTGFALFGDVFLAKATTTTGREQFINLGIGVLVYALVAFGFFYMYKIMEFSSSGVLSSLMSILIYVGVGFVMFREQINLYEWAGIGFAILSVFLLSRFA